MQVSSNDKRRDQHVLFICKAKLEELERPDGNNVFSVPHGQFRQFYKLKHISLLWHTDVLVFVLLCTYDMLIWLPYTETSYYHASSLSSSWTSLQVTASEYYTGYHYAGYERLNFMWD